MLKLLFDEFDVTADSVGIKEPGRKWQEAGASKPAVGRQLTNEVHVHVDRHVHVVQASRGEAAHE